MRKEKDTSDRRLIAVMSIVRTADILNRFLQIELAKHHSSSSRFAIMNALFVHGGRMTPTAISRWVFRAKHSVTGILKVLERAGVVRREASTEDRRSVSIVITEKGADGLPKMMKAAEEISKEALSTFNEQELQRFMKLLKELRRHLLRKMAHAGNG
jgi:DNA-binding MarR family transcriptional regulator